jgi:hypothetical protein
MPGTNNISTLLLAILAAAECDRVIDDSIDPIDHTRSRDIDLSPASRPAAQRAPAIAAIP